MCERVRGIKTSLRLVTPVKRKDIQVSESEKERERKRERDEGDVGKPFVQPVRTSEGEKQSSPFCAG